MVNRDRHEITMDILRKASSPLNKTELMRDVGLSFLQTKQYITVLVDKGLLEVDSNKCYKTTKQGIDFLEKCETCALFRWETQKKKRSSRT